MKKLKIEKPIRLIELFGGVGAQAMALRDVGADFERYRYVDFDKYAVKSYNAIHGTDFPVIDITQFTGDDLGIVDTDKYCYIMFYSYPCFTGDTLVLTSEGYKQIKDVVVNDSVLTHNNVYKKVIASRQTGVNEIYKINAMGVDEIKCTEHHKFYVRKLKRKFPYLENGKRGNIRYFESPEWRECKDLDKSYYLGVAINQKSQFPIWGGIEFTWSDGRKRREVNEICKLMHNNSFWWIAGRYVGDGWLRPGNGIVICCAKDELNEITPHLDNCGLHYTVVEERTVYKLHIPKTEIGCFFEEFGKGALNKRIPSFMFNLPVDCIQNFLTGYLSSDGYTAENGVHKITSVSRELIYGTAQLIAKAYHAPYSIYKIKRPTTYVIEGRVVNQHDYYTVTWKDDKRKQDKAFYEDGYIWFPIKSIEKQEEQEPVYDIEVDTDHSFTANGVIVHNCQDLSLAGKGKGMDEGSGTRSSLLWECKRLLSETKNLPQILMMENVPQVHSKKNMDNFQKWLDFLTSLGYTTVWHDMNAKDYGVAQSRNRTIAVSFLGDYEFEFPEPIPLTKRLKDYLEEKVDEKFYLTSDKARALIDKLIKEDRLPMSTKTVKLTGWNSNHLTPDAEENDVACTLMARDWKGPSNYGYNGVVEINE